MNEKHKIPIIDVVKEIIEEKRQKVLSNPADPSWTEHFAELSNEISTFLDISFDKAVKSAVKSIMESTTVPSQIINGTECSPEEVARLNDAVEQEMKNVLAARKLATRTPMTSEKIRRVIEISKKLGLNDIFLE